METEKFRFLKLIEMSRLELNEIVDKRASLFYILASSKNLFNQADMIYDFKNNRLKLELDDEYNIILGLISLNTQENILLSLALQLYNNSNKQSIMDIFSRLNENNRMVAIEAIRMRFSIYSNEYVELE